MYTEDIIEYELAELKRITPQITHNDVEKILRRSVESAAERGYVQAQLDGDPEHPLGLID